jgi:hypothetical protein
LRWSNDTGAADTAEAVAGIPCTTGRQFRASCLPAIRFALADRDQPCLTGNGVTPPAREGVIVVPQTIERSANTGETASASARSAAGPSLPSCEQRAASGKAARARAPLEAHADFRPPPSRDLVALLVSQAKTRVPELVPIRHGRMLVSPFTFYRGAALLMAADLHTTPTSGLRTQLCGDAHLSNFGAYASPERHLVFDINDFDETLPGPFDWDVKRLAASFFIAGRDNG